MKFGIHSMVWVGDWSPKSATYAVEKTKEAGFDVIELSAIEPKSFDIELTRKLVEANDLGVTVSLGLDSSTDISSDDPQVVAAGKERLMDALRLTRDTGGTVMCGVIYSALKKFAHPPTELGRQHSIETVREVADAAKEAGVEVALEVCNHYEANLFNTAKTGLEYLVELDRPEVGLHLDSYHMNIEEQDMFSPIVETASAGKLGYIHVGESNRGPLGLGTIDWDAFFAGVTASGYDGIVTFESFSTAVVHPSFSDSLGIWRKTWTDSYAIASGALGFMKNSL